MYNPYDSIGKDIACQYADMMKKFFPNFVKTKQDYMSMKSRAKNVLGFFFKDYYIVPKKNVEHVLTENLTEDKLNMLNKLFEHDEVSDMLNIICEKNNNKFNIC